MKGLGATNTDEENKNLSSFAPTSGPFAGGAVIVLRAAG
jgi:hypothetical protein